MKKMENMSNQLSNSKLFDSYDSLRILVSNKKIDDLS